MVNVFFCNELMLLRSLNQKPKKMSRNLGYLTVVYLELPEKMLPLPPPQRTYSASGDHGKFLLLPPLAGLTTFL